MRKFKKGDIIKRTHRIYSRETFLVMKVDGLYKIKFISSSGRHLNVEELDSLNALSCFFIKATDREEFLYYTHGSNALIDGKDERKN